MHISKFCIISSFFYFFYWKKKIKTREYIFFLCLAKTFFFSNICDLFCPFHSWMVFIKLLTINILAGVPYHTSNQDFLRHTIVGKVPIKSCLLRTETLNIFKNSLLTATCQPSFYSPLEGIKQSHFSSLTAFYQPYYNPLTVLHTKSSFYSPNTAL